MGKAIQTLLVGLEAVARTRADDSGMTNLRFTECTVAEKFVRIIPKEEDGTRMKENNVLRGTEMTELTVKILAYVDSLPMWMTAALSAATSVAHGTGAFDHTQKGGGVDLLTLSIDYYDGESWREALGCVVDTLDAELVAEKLAEITVKLLSIAVEEITEPTIPSISIPLWAGPFDVPTQAVTVNGSAYNKLNKLGIHIKNNRAADFVMGDVSPLEFDEGDFEVEFDLDSVYKGYTGSLYKNYKENSDPGAIVYTMTGATNITGSTPAIPPVIKFTIHRPGLSDAKRVKKGGRVTESVKGKALKDGTAATSFTAFFTNATDEYVGS